MQPSSTLPPPVMSSEPPQSPKKIRSRENWRSVISTVLILIIAPIIALTLTNFVFQSYEVDGPSMESTLQHKDRLIVWKVPKTIARITNKHYVPERGDIVIFMKRGLSDFSGQENKQLIKRVIALPGERVSIRDNLVTVYSVDRPEGFNPDLEGTYQTPTGMTNGVVDLVVPNGEVFVLGDNRQNSLDSRSFGTISSDDLVGVLAFRIFPFNKAKSF